MELDKELIDKLLADYKGPEDLIGEQRRLKQLTKALVERAMQAELTRYLGYAKNDPAGHGSGNSRNGVSSKTLKGISVRRSSKCRATATAHLFTRRSWLEDNSDRLFVREVLAAGKTAASASRRRPGDTVSQGFVHTLLDGLHEYLLIFIRKFFLYLTPQNRNVRYITETLSEGTNQIAEPKCLS